MVIQASSGYIKLSLSRPEREQGLSREQVEIR